MNFAPKTLVCVLALAQAAALAQGSQEQQAAYYERLRREREAEEQRRQEAQREREFRDMLEQRERDKSRTGSAAPPVSPAPQAESSGGPSLGGVVGAAALLIGGAYLLERWLSDDKPAAAPARPLPPVLPPVSGHLFDAQDLSFATERNPDPATAGYSPQLLYIYHAPAFDPRGQGITHAEYYPSGHVLLVHRDGRRFDIGQRVQLAQLHQAIRQAGLVTVMQTRNRQILTLQVLPLKQMF